jgi:hypothetical protein
LHAPSIASFPLVAPVERDHDADADAAAGRDDVGAVVVDPLAGFSLAALALLGGRALAHPASTRRGRPCGTVRPQIEARARRP